MGYSRKILIVLLFLLSTVIQARKENNTWVLGIATNAIDFYPTGKALDPIPDISESLLDRAFETKHWNIFPMISQISIEKYIGSNFAVELVGSINKIEEIGNVSIAAIDYFGIDFMMHYSFRNIINRKGWLDPYLGLRGGYSEIGEFEEFNTNGVFGINFWLTDKLAINLQATYKEGYKPSAEIEVWHGNDYFQYAVGIKYAIRKKDRDGDGIPDSDDACAYKVGLEKFNGCPDYDGDGIPYQKDRCPRKVGPSDNQGCPYEDFDGDGVFDKDDACPNVLGVKSNKGCPQITSTDLGLINKYAKTILFDSREAIIPVTSYGALNAIVEIMQKFPETIFHVAGYAYENRNELANKKLSIERASVVRIYLASHGISSDRIAAMGYGDQQKKRHIEVYLEKSKPDANNMPQAEN